MTIFLNLDPVQIAEEYAKLMRHEFDSEQAVSEIFDDDILPSIISDHGLMQDEVYLKIDVNDLFDDWMMDMEEYGNISEDQRINYSYMGRYMTPF